MYLREAAAELLLTLDQPVITEYELFVRAAEILAVGSFGGKPITRPPDDWDVARNRALIRNLMRHRVLVPDDDFRSGVWRIVQAVTAGSAEEACCLADPFCYVSHLSAMHRYNLTDRAPFELHLTTPYRQIWNEMRNDKMDRDLSNLSPRLEVPAMNRIGFKKRVRKREVSLHETRHPATPVPIRGEKARIAPIGHVFVEMLEDPRLCGGIRHVLDVWHQESEPWLNDIIDEVDRHISKIVRVRAGYILEERLGISHPKLKAWVRDAQRGGSRKLDPDAPYAPTYSERWMLSINVGD
jgi:predicted transcriptional regulator of viral defense system